MKYKVDIPKLKAQMVLNGYTISSLSQKIGVTRNTLSAVFNGKNPSYSIMCLLIDVLNLDGEKAGEIFFATNLRIA